VRRRHANTNTNGHPDNNTNADTLCHSKTYSYAPAAPNSSTSSNPLKRRPVIRRSHSLAFVPGHAMPNSAKERFEIRKFDLLHIVATNIERRARSRESGN
jgi:hypothetical protein